MDFHLSNRIASGFTVNPHLWLPIEGAITSAEAATWLELHQTTVQIE